MDRNPKSPWNPSVAVELTPTQFEELILDWLLRCCPDDKQQMKAEHRGVIQGIGGAYEIDVLVKLTILSGADVTVLVECKHQKRPVERKDVLELESKLRDVGAHKGMLFSTSGFQQGAIQYAGAHGIATVTVVEGKWLYETKDMRSGPAEPPPWVKFEPHAGILMTSMDKSISCHTFDLARLEALKKWFSGGATWKQD